MDARDFASYMEALAYRDALAQQGIGCAIVVRAGLPLRVTVEPRGCPGCAD